MSDSPLLHWPGVTMEQLQELQRWLAPWVRILSNADIAGGGGSNVISGAYVGYDSNGTVPDTGWLGRQVAIPVTVPKGCVGFSIDVWVEADATLTGAYAVGAVWNDNAGIAHTLLDAGSQVAVTADGAYHQLTLPVAADLTSSAGATVWVGCLLKAGGGSGTYNFLDVPTVPTVATTYLAVSGAYPVTFTGATQVTGQPQPISLHYVPSAVTGVRQIVEDHTPPNNTVVVTNGSGPIATIGVTPGAFVEAGSAELYDTTVLIANAGEFIQLLNNSELAQVTVNDTEAVFGWGVHDIISTSAGLQLGATTGAKLGFLGTAPVVRQSTPVTLSDVINLLKAYGLCP